MIKNVAFCEAQQTDNSKMDNLEALPKPDNSFLYNLRIGETPCYLIVS